MHDDYYAKLCLEKNTPMSINYADYYFSTDSGIDEVNHVFIEKNDFKKRFTNLTDNDTFTITETGFGVGLNFLVTLQLWQKTVKTQAKLFFVSFEKHPLSPADLAQILNSFPTLKDESKQLLDQYNLILPITHRLHFANNIYLNLVIGDINDTIIQQNFAADAWLLDGFAPNKNSAMWTYVVLQNIARLSKPNATFATFTASSNVRRNLIANGFVVNKAPGFSKRDMLYGYKDIVIPNLKLKSKPQISYSSPHKNKPWFTKYHNHNPDKKVIVIGGGISGAATAYSLARRGYQVTLYEKNSSLALEASGNYQGILYGNFTGNYTPIIELFLSGYRYSYNLITTHLTKDIDYQVCGLIQLLNTRDYKKLATIFPRDFCHHVNKEEIIKLANLEIKADHGLYFPFGLWLNLATLVKQLTTHPNIKIVLNSNIKDILYANDVWSITTGSGIIDEAPNLVLCNSYMLNQFSHTAKINLRSTRGQITKVNGNINLHTILCDNSYITPNANEYFTLGATFKPNINNDINIKEAEHEENINNIATFMPQIKQYTTKHNVSGQAAIRSSSGDYLPLVGPVTNYAKFKDTYRALAKDANYTINSACPNYPGLFINVAHGSKGILTAPISGEIITDYIDNSPNACNEYLRQALHPNRFWLKEIIKSKIADL